MKYALILARVALGLPLVIFGLNGFFGFFEPPTDGVPPDAIAFLEALSLPSYFLPLKSGIEVLCGVFFLTGLFVPFGLILFAPILVNIVGYHLTLDPGIEHGAIGFAMLAAEVFLAFAYAGSFRSVLAPRAKSRFGC